MRNQRKILAPLSALACALLLQACASSKPETRIQIEYLPPPEPLLTCAAAPAVPDTGDQSIVGEYLLDLWSAGEDCRTKLKAVRDWVKEENHAKSQ